MKMKTIRRNFHRALLAVLLLLILAASAPAYAVRASSDTAAGGESAPAAASEADSATEEIAAPPYSEEYYRAVDVSDGLTEAQQNDLDGICLDFARAYHADLAMLALPSTRHPEDTIGEIAEGYYESCGFGYGDGKDGFQLVWFTDTGEVLIAAFGAAKDMIPQDYLEFTEKTILKFEEEYGVYGPFYAASKMLSDYIEDHGAASDNAAIEESVEAAVGEAIGEKAAEAAGESAGEAAGNAAGENASGQETTAGTPDSGSSEAPAPALPADMPAWYPADPANFQFFHDENAPRIVDDADLFTAEEEARMEARVSEIRAELNKDIVVFTDMSTHGLSRAVYAADFYDFNGYGCGEEREGVCLFICMDPDNRGFWSCCTGSITRGLYTEAIANQIDDLLYEYMVAGTYTEGVEDWIENFRRLYITGSPYTPEWALISEDSFTRFHDENAPRVVDDAKILSDEEERLLSAQAAEIAAKYGVDVVVHTALDPGALTSEEFARKYYVVSGYGKGDGYDGIELTIFKRPYYSAFAEVSGFGSVLSKLTDKNRTRLKDRCGNALSDDDYYKAASAWLDQAGHMLKTGRAPRSAGSWGFVTALELIAGLIFGGRTLSKARRKMAAPQLHQDADAYLVPGSLKVAKLRDTFLYSTTSRHYSPVKTEDRSSGGSSSGGRSSYSSSYSGSSGSSHSGSGRSF